MFVLIMSKFVIFPRIRKKSGDPKKFIRLPEVEFAHDYNKKSFIKNNYYPDAEVLINEIAKKFYKKKSENILIGLGAESLIKIQLFGINKDTKLEIL